MKYIKYIFFSLTLFLISNNVYANSYVILNKNNINEIKEILQDNKNITINLDYETDDLIIDRKILDLIKNKDKIITYNILNNDEVIYKYIFNGNYITKSYNNIDLKIEFTSDKEEYINEIFNTKNKYIIKTNYKGNYPPKTILSIKNTKELNKIFIYNLNNDNISKMKNIITNNTTYIDININKGNTYIITNKELIKMETIIIYIIVLIILFIEIILFAFIAFFKKDIELSKLKKNKKPN